MFLTKSPFLILFIVPVIFFTSCFPGQDKKEETTSEENRPNIVFIFADDVGWNEVGFNNEDKKYTPHIDQLRDGGLSLTQFYVHAVCAPSRTAFLTGRYPFRTWTDWRSEDFGKPSYLEKLVVCQDLIFGLKNSFKIQFWGRSP